MPTTPLLEQLLGPFSVSKFIADHWGKNWLLLDKQARATEDFPTSMAQVDEFFANVRLRYPWVKLISKGTEVPFKEYRNPRFSPDSDVIDNKKLLSYLDQGYAIVANSIDKSFFPIARICRQLEQELSVKVWANLYVSPDSGYGFGIHQDMHDLMVLQLAGSKNWKVYAMDEDYEYHGPRAAGPDDVALKEFQMTKGDLVFLPKKQPHMAYSAGGPSVHITIGFEGLFWEDLVDELAQKAKQDRDFGQRVPIGLEGKEAFEHFVQSFKRKWDSFLQEHNAESLIESTQAKWVVQSDRQKDGSITTWLESKQLTAESKVMKCPQTALEVSLQGRFLHLKFYEEYIRFPEFLSDLLHGLLSEQPIRIADISCAQSPEERVKVAQKLVEIGLINLL